MEEEYYQLDRPALTEATLLEIEMENCVDPQEYNELWKEYADLLYDYNLFEGVARVDDSQVHEEINWEDIIFQQDGKWGLLPTWLNEGVPAIYDAIECIEESNVYKVTKDGKEGIIWMDDKSHILVPIEYDSIAKIDDELYIGVKGNKKYYINGSKASTEGYDDIRIPALAGWIHVKKGDKWGFLNGDLDFTENEEEAHEYFLPNFCNKDYIDLKKHDASRQTISECDKMESTVDGMDKQSAEWKEYEMKSYSLTKNYTFTTFESGGKYGLKDFLGFEILPPIYDEIVSDEDSTPAYYGKKDGKWAFLGRMDIEGHLFFLSDEIPQFAIDGNWAIAHVGEKYGLYSITNGDWILEPIYDQFTVENNKECIITRIGNKYGFFDGNTTIMPEYDTFILSRCVAFVRAKKDGEIGFFDKEGNWVQDIQRACLYTKDPSFYFDYN